MLYSVQVRLEGDDLAIRMTDLREWLDRNRIEPVVFNYRMDAEGVLFRLDFEVSSEAVAFTEAFGGTLV